MTITINDTNMQHRLLYKETTGNMKKKPNDNYISRFLQMDPKNTLLVLILKTVSALFLSAETLIIAMLIDHIVSGIAVSQGGAVFRDTALLALFWLAKRGILFVGGICQAKLKRTVYEKLPSRVMEKKASLSYLTLENQENQELIRRIGTDTAAKFYEIGRAHV